MSERRIDPALIADTDRPAFTEPWHARAFGMTLALYEAGQFTWPEWTQAISTEIAAARERGEADTGTTYYDHWLAALERIVAEKRIATGAALLARKDEWAHAAAHTPHGQPIVLGAGHDHDHDDAHGRDGHGY